MNALMGKVEGSKLENSQLLTQHYITGLTANDKHVDINTSISIKVKGLKLLTSTLLSAMNLKIDQSVS